MKKVPPRSLAWPVVVGGCLLLTSFGQPVAHAQSPPATRIVLTNALPVTRANEIIAIDRKALGQSNGTRLPKLSQRGKELTTQLVDENGDGGWDTLLAEVSLPARATDTLQLTWVETNGARTWPKATNIRLSLQSKTTEPSAEIRHLVRGRGFVQSISNPVYQMQGPGIENDKVAFRTFFDASNGRDVYGKLGAEPILEQVGLIGTWHKLQPWGMDVLKTGNSLGAGGMAVWENGGLFRLADADTSVFTALHEGPLRAQFRLDYKNWDVGTIKRNGLEIISLTKGDFFYKNELTVPLRPDQQLVVGIANFKDVNAVYRQHNAQFGSISTFGKQADGTDTHLGLALLFRNDAYVNHETTTAAAPIPNTTYLVLKPVARGSQPFYFFAGWEKTDPRFASPDGFAQYLQQTANRLASPIQIHLIRPKPAKRIH